MYDLEQENNKPDKPQKMLSSRSPRVVWIFLFDLAEIRVLFWGKEGKKAPREKLQLTPCFS